MKRKRVKANIRRRKKNYDIFIQIVTAALTLQIIDWSIKNIAVKNFKKVKKV